MVQTSPTPFDVGRAFVHQYYTLLHQAPHMLHRFYSTDSTFIHGGVDRPGCVEQPAVGPESISQRINDLNLRDCHAKIRQVDSHPTIGEGVVVQVTGELSNNGDPMRRFMQTFVLAPRQPKKYYVQNDIFRYQDEVFDDASDEVDEDDRSSSHIYGDTISNVDKVSNAESAAALVASQQPLLVTTNARATLGEQQPSQPLPPRSNGPTMPGNHTQVIPTQVVRQQEHQHTESNNLNGFSNAGESTNYGGHGHGHLQQPQETVPSHTQPSPRPVNHQVAQENQSNGSNGPAQQQGQQVKQTAPAQQQSQQQPSTEGQRAEGTSYAGIAKLNSSSGPTANVNSAGLTSTSAPRVTPTTAAVPTSTAQQPNAVRPPVKSSTGPTGRPSNTPQSGQQQQHFSQPRGGGGSYYGQNNRNNHWNDAPQKEHSPARRSGPNAIAAPNENQVFVGSLPAEFTPATLIECFSKFGRVLDAKIHSANGDNKKSFGFVAFENAETASQVVAMEHVAYSDTILLNVEPKTQKNFPPNNNAGGSYNNGSQGGGRNSGGYQPRGGGRGGNRGSYRGGGLNPRRGGGQFSTNSFSFTAGDDNNNNDYRPSKPQQQQQQQPQQQ